MHTEKYKEGRGNNKNYENQTHGQERQKHEESQDKLRHTDDQKHGKK